MDNNAILSMIDISKSFPGVKALDKASITVKAGTVHALMGENGAGKSTLMKCLFGVYKKDSGRILLGDDEIDFNFDASVLDELDDYESPTTTKKSETLANTNMQSKSSRRFEANTDNSGIGFRNKQQNSSETIGFRKKENSEDGTIGFKRKSKTAKVEPEEEFNSEDFLNQMEENLKKTTSKAKKTTTRRKNQNNK